MAFSKYIVSFNMSQARTHDSTDFDVQPNPLIAINVGFGSLDQCCSGMWAGQGFWLRNRSVYWRNIRKGTFWWIKGYVTYLFDEWEDVHLFLQSAAWQRNIKLSQPLCILAGWTTFYTTSLHTQGTWGETSLLQWSVLSINVSDYFMFCFSNTFI